MTTYQDYQIVKSLDEAFQSLSPGEDLPCLVAGGTDLLLELQQGRHKRVNRMLDIHSIPELLELKIDNNQLLIGAAIPVSDIACSPLIKEHAQAVSDASALIGGPQVRNVATLGGNVAHALPAADGMIALVAMDAMALIASPTGFFEKPILQLFSGPGITTLLPDQIITRFSVKMKEKGEGSAFRRIMRPQGVALPILNLAIWIKRDRELIQDIRIVFGPSGPTPCRAVLVEDVFRGKNWNSALLQIGIDAISSTVKFRTSKNRASAEYRYQIAKYLFTQTINDAWEKAGQDNNNGND